MRDARWIRYRHFVPMRPDRQRVDSYHPAQLRGKMRRKLDLVCGAWVLPCALALAVVTGCERISAPTELPPIQAASGGGGKTASLTVKATQPSSAPRGATLDVRILGSGFDATAAVSFALNGTPAPKLIT